ncbi:hypothetical protein PHIN3_28 [Sinorhizobium phage phiN3]|uniref:Uncharacterized protein n=1 Tax=Sinorhizobium phage phiN3 TaxID=1647405 RepID=A0A0F6SIZ1_9CAUD|nr:hypothetical protein AVT40_gp028 [Sinorhizobium phage phiN3]AKF13293.1 hypothetical protein PHIN3_28 [Sinorhizobium phage phiN3]
MKNRKAIAKLRAYKGPVYGCMLVNNDVMYVQLVKSDLIEQLKQKGPDVNTVSVELTDGVMYVDRPEYGDNDEEGDEE